MNQERNAVLRPQLVRSPHYCTVAWLPGMGGVEGVVRVCRVLPTAGLYVVLVGAITGYWCCERDFFGYIYV